jgi:hypothetical protein
MTTSHSCTGSFVGGFLVGILVTVLTAYLLVRYTLLLDRGILSMRGEKDDGDA